MVEFPFSFQPLACRCAIGTGFALFLCAGVTRRSVSQHQEFS
jgi:hypothetical protein